MPRREGHGFTRATGTNNREGHGFSRAKRTQVSTGFSRRGKLPWSSFRHYLTGVHGIVEIESEWTAREREGAPVRPDVGRAGGAACCNEEVNYPGLANTRLTGAPGARVNANCVLKS